ncbi:MAG: hypothetical protein H6737_23125 [Alphaproteobacteria bacterium]|nr:hypothetical protein [Alphaproteobacteria bacterium]
MLRSSALLVLIGCAKAPPAADPEFNDAAIFLLREFDGPEADLAFALRQVEEQVYLSIDVAAERVQERALSPAPVTTADVERMNGEGRDPALALPVAVAKLSAFEPADHASIQMLVDHTPVEPYSPDLYERTFLDGDACWEGIGCQQMQTTNDLIKVNALMEVHYELLKDFRWIDMNLPDPSTVPEGEEVVNTGEPRWAFIARAWTDRTFDGEGGNVHIHQSYTIDSWIPRDGGGFVRTGAEQNTDDGEWTTDSTGGGTLRMLALWAETDLGFPVGDDVVIGTTRSGIDDNMTAAEEWLAAR